jgi:hypothetical protein
VKRHLPQRIGVVMALMLSIVPLISPEGCEENDPPSIEPLTNPPVSTVPPIVVTGAASNVAINGATLNGSVSSMGSAFIGDISFQYGLSASYGSTASGSPPMSINAKADISGLTPSTTYHFRAVYDWHLQSGGSFTTYGADQTFTTLAPIPPLTFASATLSPGISNEPYEAILIPAGGKTPYTFSVGSGTLPPGLRLIGLDDRCRIEGTPTGYGEYSFGITVRDTSSTAVPNTATFKLVVYPNLKGKWAFTTVVTAAGGVCSDELGHTSTRSITVEQQGSLLVFSGFLGDPGIRLNGDLFLPSSDVGAGKWIIKFGGSYFEDGGTTTSNRTLELTSPTTMKGDERWSWTGPGGDCPGGFATISVLKEPGS